MFHGDKYRYLNNYYYILITFITFLKNKIAVLNAMDT
jgi:hypothetical protein